MPLAIAASVPDEEHMEMVMTPVIPMSLLHCDQCVTVTRSMGNLFSGKTSCAGHCLSQGDPTIVGTIFSGTSPDITPVLSVFSVTSVSHNASIVVPRSTVPPLAFLVDTIVLRL